MGVNVKDELMQQNKSVVIGDVLFYQEHDHHPKKDKSHIFVGITNVTQAAIHTTVE